MKFIIARDYQEMSAMGAEVIIDQINKKPDTVLGLATGSTPLGTYNLLIDACKKGLDFSKVVTFNLDEYWGLPPYHPQSYNYFMNKNLFDHINILKAHTHIPSGQCADPEEECRRYDSMIENMGGIDLQVLGIGRNGHIGFNEPAESLKLNTHLTSLTEDTIEANSRFFNSINEVPKKAITMGIGSIMKAKKIILLASGKDKAPIISKLAEKKVSTKIPASILHLHKDTVVIVDRDAASLLPWDNTTEI